MKQFDQNFIDALKKDGEKEWESLYSFCYKHALSYIKNQSDAQDIASDTVLKIREALKTFKQTKGRGNIESNFKAWVKKIVFNAYLDFRERAKREATFDLLANALGMNGDDRELIESDIESMDRIVSLKAYERSPFRNNPEWNLAVKEILEILNLIKEPRKRIALLLKYMYDFKTDEIAELMRENFDSIQTVIHRTRAEMKAIYEARGIDSGYLSPEAWRIKHLIH